MFYNLRRQGSGAPAEGFLGLCRNYRTILQRLHNIEAAETMPTLA
jgi:hypothetical protein